MAALLVLVAVSGIAVGIVIGLRMRVGAHRAHSRALVLAAARPRGRARHVRRAAA